MVLGSAKRRMTTSLYTIVVVVDVVVVVVVCEVRQGRQDRQENNEGMLSFFGKRHPMKAPCYCPLPRPTASVCPITCQSRPVRVGRAADPGRLPALAVRSAWVRSPTYAVSACNYRLYVDATWPHRTGNHRLCYPMRRQVVAPATSIQVILRYVSDIIIRKALVRAVNCERTSYSPALSDRLFVWGIGFMARRVIGRFRAIPVLGVSEHRPVAPRSMALAEGGGRCDLPFASRSVGGFVPCSGRRAWRPGRCTEGVPACWRRLGRGGRLVVGGEM